MGGACGLHMGDVKFIQYVCPFRKYETRVSTGLGGLLWIRLWTAAFRKRRGISWPAERLSSPQQGIRSREWV